MGRCGGSGGVVKDCPQLWTSAGFAFTNWVEVKLGLISWETLLVFLPNYLLII